MTENYTALYEQHKKAGASFTTCAHRLTSTSTFRACGSNCWPAALKATRRVVRSKSRTPSESSNRRIRSLNAVGDRATSRAACRKLSWLAAASKHRRLSKSIVPFISTVL